MVALFRLGDILQRSQIINGIIKRHDQTTITRQPCPMRFNTFAFQIRMIRAGGNRLAPYFFNRVSCNLGFFRPHSLTFFRRLGLPSCDRHIFRRRKLAPDVGLKNTINLITPTSEPPRDRRIRKYYVPPAIVALAPIRRKAMQLSVDFNILRRLDAGGKHCVRHLHVRRVNLLGRFGHKWPAENVSDFSHAASSCSCVR